MPDKYVYFEGTGLRLWLNDPKRKTFVKGKGWIPYKDLQIRDRMIFGKVVLIGTEVEGRAFWDALEDACREVEEASQRCVWDILGELQ